MNARIKYLKHYALHAAAAQLTLCLFDSNPWWKVLIFSLFSTGLNLVLANYFHQKNWMKIYKIASLAILPAFLAYLLSLTPFFRSTFGTLVGFVLLVALLEWYNTLISSAK